jgi:hypothetical protein
MVGGYNDVCLCADVYVLVGDLAYQAAASNSCSLLRSTYQVPTCESCDRLSFKRLIRSVGTKHVSSAVCGLLPLKL